MQVGASFCILGGNAYPHGQSANKPQVNCTFLAMGAEGFSTINRRYGHSSS